MINQTVDNRYQIESIIGRGGMGVVYRATDLLQKQSVALKFMHHYLDNRNTAFTRFQREFRTLAKLDHPNIVRTFGFGAHEGAPYLVLEYLEGHTLGDELASDRPLSRDQLLDISRQICVALTYLHTQSIVHRDLKPGNLMLLNADTSPQVKLMDFGLVRTAELSMQLTQEGVALGTMAYIAPEQAQGIPVDFRADLYALGIILYEMAAGRPPFVHDNPAMLLMSQITTNPPPPSQFNPNLDEPLEQLILQLLSKEPAGRPSSTDKVAAHLAQLADDSGPIPAVTPKKRVDIIPRVPLIGREKTLAQLNQWRVEVRQGTGKFMLLSGVAGAGKTRLLTEFKLQARLDNDRYLRGHCLEHGSLPYQPLIEILNPLARDLPPSERDTLPPELTRLLPGISSSSVDIKPTTINQPDAKLHLFNGCCELLRRSAQNKALMIAIEDVQWVDPSTLELISYLAHRAHEAPVMLAVSYRPEEIEPGSTINTALQELSRVGPTVSLELLSREQVESYLQMALGKSNLPDWLVDSFYQSTDGNPLFIEETLKMLAAEGQVADWVKQDSSRRTSMSSITLQLPKTVLALAERRLQLLSDEDRSILTAAAVLGQEFPFALLQTVTKLDEDPLLDAIDRLLAARLIEELPLQDGDDFYSFVQEALRQALLSTISQRRLRRMHQRSGEAIQSIYDTGQSRYWPLLAYHFTAAGDNDRALKYFTLAGDAAANLYATAEAVNYYNNAITIIKAEQAEATADQRLHLYIQRGRNLELNNLFDEALSNYKAMLEMAKAVSDQSLELEALLAMAVLHTTPTPLHDLEQGQSLCQQSLTLARQIDDQPAEAKALWNIMNIHKFKEEFQQAITVGNQGLDIARRLNLRQQMAYILNDISWIYINAGQMDTALQSSAEARALWKELNNLPMLADNLTGGATYNLISGQLATSMDEANQSLEVSRKINNIWNISQSGWIKGLIHLIWGEFEKAIDTLEGIISLESTNSFANPQVNAWADLGLIYGTLGHIEQGIAFCLEAQENVSSEMFQNWQSYPSAILAQLYVLKGDFKAANQAIDACRPKLNESGITPAVVWLATAEAELAIKFKNYDQALEIANQLNAQLRQMGLNVFLDLGLYLKGQALLAQNRNAEAREALQEALQLAQAQTARYILWHIQIELYKLEQQAGNPADAQHMHQQARQTIEYIVDHAPLHLRASFLARPKIRQIMDNV